MIRFCVNLIRMSETDEIWGTRDLQPEAIERFGDDIRRQCHAAANLMRRLAAAGWTSYTTVYDVYFEKASIRTEEDLARELVGLGVDPSMIGEVYLDEDV